METELNTETIERRNRSFELGILILLWALFCQFVLSPKALAREVAVVVHINDGTAAVDEKDLEDVLRFLKDSLPGHKIVVADSFLAYDSDDLDEKDAVRAEIRSKLESQLDKNDQVTHLILSTHGTSDITSGGVRAYSMRGIGQVHPGLGLLSTLWPLKGHVVEGAHIVLNSCSPFCDLPDSKLQDDLAKIEIARAFLDFFEVKNGSVYGANQTTSSEHFIYNEESNLQLSRNRTRGRRVLNWVVGAAGMGIGTVGMLPILKNFSQLWMNQPDVAISGLMVIGVSIGLYKLSRMTRGQILENGKSENVESFEQEDGPGSYFRFEAGQMPEVLQINRVTDRNAAYGISCSEILSN